jgi:dihydroneopterin aldolase
VQSSATGRPDFRAIPRAKNEAERSSRTGIASTPSCWAKAIASGVERDPGQITAVVNPSRFKVSVRMEAKKELVFLKSIISIPERDSRVPPSQVTCFIPFYFYFDFILDWVQEDSFVDCIHLTGIRCYGYTGYLSEEQVLGQWFEVDVTLWLDLSVAGKSDAIEDTLDYRSIISTVQQLVKTSKFALVERLATAIAEAILLSKQVAQVQVRLSKPAAPIPDFGGTITIDITRNK